MKIDIHNYEALMLDYLDGILEEGLSREMEAFLLMHPHIADDLEGIEELQLSQFNHEPLEEAFIDQLKKKKISPFEQIHENNYHTFFIGHWEGDLNPAEEKTLQVFLAHNDFLKSDFETFKTIQLNPSQSIIYEGKSSLKKKNNKVIAMWSVASSVAALLLLAFWIFNPTAPRETQYYQGIQARYLSSLEVNETPVSLRETSQELLPNLVFVEEEIILPSRLETPNKMNPIQEQLALQEHQWKNELLMIQSLTFDRNQTKSQIDWASLPENKTRGPIKLISSLLWNTTKGQVKNMGQDFIQEDLKLIGSENFKEITGGIISVKKPVKEVE